MSLKIKQSSLGKSFFSYPKSLLISIVLAIVGGKCKYNHSNQPTAQQSKPTLIDSNPTPPPSPPLSATPARRSFTGSASSGLTPPPSPLSSATPARRSFTGSASSGPIPPPSPLPPIQPFAGIPNAGLTCYMNAALQIIAALYENKLPKGGLKSFITKINNSNQCLNRDDVNQFRNQLPEKLKEMVTAGHNGSVDKFIGDLNDHYDFLDRYFVYDKPASNLDTETASKWEFSTEEAVFYISYLNEYPNKSDLRALIDSTRKCWGMVHKLELPNKLCFCLMRDGRRKVEVDGAFKLFIQPDFSCEACIEYDLYGFIIHHLNPLHYTAYVKRGGKWYEANDSQICEKTEEEAKEASKNGEYFFYKRAS